MPIKKLLVAFTTSRVVNDEEKRVRFAAGKVVELTEDELETLDRLAEKTGKLHYRDPIREGKSKVQPDDPEVVETRAYAGVDTPMDKKTVPMLKAYLDFFKVEYAADANKTDLLALAKAHESGTGGDEGDEGGDGDEDPDSGL